MPLFSFASLGNTASLFLADINDFVRNAPYCLCQCFCFQQIVTSSVRGPKQEPVLTCQEWRAFLSSANQVSSSVAKMKPATMKERENRWLELEHKLTNTINSAFPRAVWAKLAGMNISLLYLELMCFNKNTKGPFKSTLLSKIKAHGNISGLLE